MPWSQRPGPLPARAVFVAHAGSRREAGIHHVSMVRISSAFWPLKGFIYTTQTAIVSDVTLPAGAPISGLRSRDDGLLRNVIVLLAKQKRTTRWSKPSP